MASFIELIELRELLSPSSNLAISSFLIAVALSSASVSAAISLFRLPISVFRRALLVLRLWMGLLPHRGGAVERL